MRQGWSGFNIGRIAILAIPLLLMFSKQNVLNSNLGFRNDIDNKKKLIENIKPYFASQEQSTLNKVKDIIDIISKFDKLKNPKYDNNISSLLQDLPESERKEKILEEIAQHLEGKGKVLEENLAETSRRVKMTKNNLDNHKKKVVASQNISNMEKMLSLFDSLDPIIKI